jgi:hypothetical protein
LVVYDFSLELWVKASIGFEGESDSHNYGFFVLS